MTAILLTCAAALIVWGSILLIRGSLIAGCLTYLLLMVCFGPYFYSFDVAGITMSLDRLFVPVLFGAWAIQWRFGKVSLKPLTWVDAALAGFVGLLMFSMLTHDFRIAGEGEVPVPQHLINGYLIPLIIFWIARQATLSERTVNLTLAALAGLGVYLAATGIFEQLGLWALVFPRYIANPELGEHFGRSRGPMVQSVSYGFYLVTGLLCLWLWCRRLPWRMQVLILTVVPLFCAAILFTKTRSVWLGSATGVLIALGFTLNGRVRVVVLGSMMAAGLMVGVLKMNDIAGIDREGTVADTYQSNDMRKSFAYVSWKMFQNRPIWGYGFGQFAEAKKEYLTDRSVDLKLEQIRDYVHHNTFLDVLTETGLIGLSFFMAVLFGWSWRSWQLIRDGNCPPWAQRIGILCLAVLGVAFWQMMAHEITFTPLDNSLIYFIAGLTVNLAGQRSESAAQMHLHTPA